MVKVKDVLLEVEAAVKVAILTTIARRTLSNNEISVAVKPAVAFNCCHLISNSFSSDSDLTLCTFLASSKESDNRKAEKRH